MSIEVHLAVDDMLHRQAGRFHDGLHVLKCLTHLAFDGRGEFSLGVAPALAGDVEKIAGENARAVRTDGFGAGRRDHPPSFILFAASVGEAKRALPHPRREDR